MKAYGGRGGGAALILNLSSRWRGGHCHVSPNEAPVLARRAAWIGAFINSSASVGNRTTIPRFAASGLVALLWGKGIWTEIFPYLTTMLVTDIMSSNGEMIVELKLESNVKSSLFLDVTENKLVDIYWRFETTCRSGHQGWSGPRRERCLTLEDGTETSVTIYAA
jgi:hypothetical protein